MRLKNNSTTNRPDASQIPTKAPWERPELIVQELGVTAAGGGHHNDTGGANNSVTNSDTLPTNQLS